VSWSPKLLLRTGGWRLMSGALGGGCVLILVQIDIA